MKPGGTSKVNLLFRLWTLFLSVVLAALSSLAQTQPPPPAQEPGKPPTEQGAPAPEHHITPEEAKKLLASVDEVLKFDSDDTKLPIRKPIKRELVSREHVQKFVQDRLKDDKDAQRLQRAEVVLKRFGLLPREFDTRSFLVKLLAEQVAGYYDPKTKTVYLLDWLPADTQLPVMAHELTHALQDQNFDLQKWADEVDTGVGGKDPQADIASDEATAARQAVTEGQAMATMLDYELAPVGGSVVKSGDFIKAMENGMTDSPDAPVFSSAPLYLKDVLVFPYTYGLEFERTLLEKGGPQRAYADVFKNPPVSTHQVMHPDAYLAGEKIAPIKVADILKPLGKSFERYDVGSVGELDFTVMMKQFADLATADRIAPNWRGAYYYAVHAKGAPADDLPLVLVSRWATPDAATQFRDFYEKVINTKYEVQSSGAGSNVSPGQNGNQPVLTWLSWQTSAGPMYLAIDGNVVVSLEGFDAATAPKLLETAFQASRDPAATTATTH